MDNQNNNVKKVWDWPIRIIHWALPVLFALLWWTAENDEMALHQNCGLVLLALLVFRLYWGFFGSNTARFSHFLCGPTTVWRYFKGLTQRDKALALGHNPLGGWSSLLLLFLLLTQVILGLFAIDIDAWEAGPLNTYVSFETGRWCAQWHEIIFNLLCAAITVHVVAVFYYLFWRKQNLIKSMITGKADIAFDEEMQPATRWHYLIAIVLAGLSLWWFW